MFSSIVSLWVESECVSVSRDMKKKKQKQGSSEHPEEPEMKKEESQSFSATNQSSKSGGPPQALKRGQKVTRQLNLSLHKHIKLC